MPFPDVLPRILRTIRSDFWAMIVLAVPIGVLAAVGAVAIRLGIGWVQHLAFGFTDERVHSLAASLLWWHRLLAPALGGLIVGFLVERWMPGRRVQGVARVIGAGRGGEPLSARVGLTAALVSVITLGFGGSAGREGPAVHLGATGACLVVRLLQLPESAWRVALGCGVAAAVAASFNAPFGGAVFALELVVGGWAVGSLLPVSIAAMVGTGVARLVFGDGAAFPLPQEALWSWTALPGLAMLGLVSAPLAILFIETIRVLDGLIGSLPAKRWWTTALGGAGRGGDRRPLSTSARRRL